MVHRYCEEFGCSISQAAHDLENVPHGLIYEVLDLRHFMRVKSQLDVAKKKADGPTGPMADRVWEAMQAVLAERKEQRLGPNSGRD